MNLLFFSYNKNRKYRIQKTRDTLRNCLKITYAVSEGCFFECKEKTQTIRASPSLFDAAIGKRDKAKCASY